MIPGQSSEHPQGENKMLEGSVDPRKEPLPFLPSEIQQHNIFVIEVAAKRFPVHIDEMPSAELAIVDVQVDDASQQAQVVLSVSLEFANEPHPFDISFRLLSEFTYDPQVSKIDVTRFLEMGSMSIMLPFAREVLLSICMRLQVPPIMLPMVKLAPPPSLDTRKGEISKEAIPE